jgi:hypothetical protein
MRDWSFPCIILSMFKVLLFNHECWYQGWSAAAYPKSLAGRHIGLHLAYGGFCRAWTLVPVLWDSVWPGGGPRVIRWASSLVIIPSAIRRWPCISTLPQNPLSRTETSATRSHGVGRAGRNACPIGFTLTAFSIPGLVYLSETLASKYSDATVYPDVNLDHIATSHRTNRCKAAY